MVDNRDSTDLDPIDIVIPWVDGDHPDISNKRKQFVAAAKRTKKSEQDTLEYDLNIRWEQDQELTYCLQSIKAFMPWVRKIWIVTDAQTPPIDNVDDVVKNKITVIDHKVIFRDYEHCLPTFNSASIGLMCWRIPGLANKFIIGNDDLFFIGPTLPSDFFIADRAKFRGKALPIEEHPTKLMYSKHKINAALMVAPDARLFFSGAHVHQPVFRDLIESHFAAYPNLLEDNVQHRFRSSEQVNLSALSAHLCLRDNRFILVKKKDYIHIPANWSDGSVKRSTARKKIKLSLKNCKNDKMKFLCVNDLRGAQKYYPRSLSKVKKLLPPAPKYLTIWGMIAQYIHKS